jgi:hypothetical protein
MTALVASTQKYPAMTTIYALPMCVTKPLVFANTISFLVMTTMCVPMTPAMRQMVIACTRPLFATTKMYVHKIAVISHAVVFLLKNNVPLQIAILPRVIQSMAARTSL